MTKVKLVKIYNNILEEESFQIRFERNQREYCGALFFEPDSEDKVVETLATCDVAGSDDKEEVEKVIDKYMELGVGKIKLYNGTKNTMMHWQFIHGFSDFCPYGQSKIQKKTISANYNLEI